MPAGVPGVRSAVAWLIALTSIGMHAPVYFLVGDRNPLHRLVEKLRVWVDTCKQDIVWDLVRGGDHDKEDRALDRKKVLAVLDWLSDHVRTPAK